MWELTGLVLIAFMLCLLPQEAYKKSKTVVWIVVLIYSGIYLYIIRQSGTGRFLPLDVLWIGLMVAYMIIRPLSWPLIKMKDLAEFEIAYRFLYLVLFTYLLFIRRINTGFSFSISGMDWLITVGATMVMIILGTLLSGGFRKIVTPRNQILPKKILITGIYMFFWVATSQEILFRGIIQNFLSQWFGPWAALIFGTIIFGLAHVNYNGPKMVLIATCAGLIYGSVYLFTGNVLCAVICHTLTNVYWKASVEA